MKLKLLLAAAFTSAFVVVASPSEAGGEDEIVVVVNKGNPITVATREELRPIFQTTKTQWADGTRTDPINLPEDNTLRQGFDAAVLGLDPDRVARYWVDRKIRGGERPPRKAATSGAVVRSVAGERGAVGYVRKSEANDTVKIVARVRGGLVVAP